MMDRATDINVCLARFKEKPFRCREERSYEDRRQPLFTVAGKIIYTVTNSLAAWQRNYAEPMLSWPTIDGKQDLPG
jgi:hypothetical protein